jgi:sugar transferase (PEP-CTERM/EpsH1 system associated)
VRVLFLAPYLPSLIRVRPLHFVRELARRHEVSVLVTGSSHDWSDVDHLRGICRRVELIPLRVSRQLASCARAAASGEPLQAAVCRSPELSGRLESLLACEQFDVVHVEHLRAAHLLQQLPPEQPRVYDAVDCISLLLDRTRNSSHSRLQRWLARLEVQRTRAYEARLLRPSQPTIVSAPEDAAALRRLKPGSPVTVVANGVDLDYFRPSLGPREVATIVFSGKMSYHANVSAVLYFVRDVLPLVKAANPEVRLRIVGSRPPARVLELARDPSIEVTGHVADIRESVSSATLAVCPVTVKVGIQNKILEAMAMGVPVVATRQGARGLAAEAGQDLLVGDSAVELAHHIRRLLGDSTLRAELGRLGRKYVERHHRWSAAASQLEEIYASAREPLAGRLATAT